MAGGVSGGGSTSYQPPVQGNTPPGGNVESGHDSAPGVAPGTPAGAAPPSAAPSAPGGTPVVSDRYTPGGNPLPAASGGPGAPPPVAGGATPTTTAKEILNNLNTIPKTVNPSQAEQDDMKSKLAQAKMLFDTNSATINTLNTTIKAHQQLLEAFRDNADQCKAIIKDPKSSADQVTAAQTRLDDIDGKIKLTANTIALQTSQMQTALDQNQSIITPTQKLIACFESVKESIKEDQKLNGQSKGGGTGGKSSGGSAQPLPNATTMNTQLQAQIVMMNQTKELTGGDSEGGSGGVSTNTNTD